MEDARREGGKGFVLVQCGTDGMVMKRPQVEQRAVEVMGSRGEEASA